MSLSHHQASCFPISAVRISPKREMPLHWRLRFRIRRPFWDSDPKSPATVWRFCQIMEAMWKGLAKPISQGAPWIGIKHPDGAVFPMKPWVLTCFNKVLTMVFPWNHGFSDGFPPWISPTSGRAGEVTSNGAILQHEAINDQRRAGPGQCGDGYLGEPVFECHLVRF